MNKLNISFLNFCLHIKKKWYKKQRSTGIVPSSYKVILISLKILGNYIIFNLMIIL